jgi:SprT protein
MENTTAQKLFSKYVPEPSAKYCADLWTQLKFEFKLARSRSSKLGDYWYKSSLNKHKITVNKDLNPYSFLVTYIHEVAHMVAGLRYGYRVKPHGEEWKAVFKELMYPLMQDHVLPEDVLMPLHDYMISPGASSCSDPALYRALAKYDAKEDFMIFLSEVPIGHAFLFGKRTFKKESIMRTRALCSDVKTGHRYYISLSAEVKVIQALSF